VNQYTKLARTLLYTSPEKNQQAYDASKLREEHCLEWLKTKKESVNVQVNIVALIGIIHGVLIIIQSALLAVIFHQIVIEKQNWNQLLEFFILLFSVIILRSLSQYFFQTLGFKAAASVKCTVREALLKQFSLLGPAYSKQQQSGALAATTLEHTEALEGYFSRYLPQQIIVAVLPLIMIAVVFPINWVVAVIFLLAGPLIPVFMALVGMGAASAQRNQFLAMSRMNAYFLDRIQGLTTLKIFGQCQAELQHINEVAHSFRERTMEVLRIAFLSSAILEFFSAVAVALVAVYVGLGLLGLVHFGPAVGITLQEALFVLLLAPEFFNPLKQLAVHYHDKAAAIGAADHILTVLEQTIPRTEATQIKSNYCIEFQQVSKNYQKRQVLKALNIQIKQGEKIALTGGSGVGKTTIFNLLLGFEAASNGSVIINSETVTQQNSAEQIAWVGQHATLFYATIADNITFLDQNISQQQIKIAADAAGVTAFSEKLDKGLQTWVGEKGYGLSGGQVQRIALARALVKRADIVLLDEPTAHLDQQTKVSFLDAIDDLLQDKTVIIASHDPLVETRMGRTIHLK
jgi:ATP-binding cassette subfamily C protein CydD